MKTALVTGCSSGIGRAVAEALMADDWGVVGLSRTRPDLLDAAGMDAFDWEQDDLSAGSTIPFGPDWTFDALVHCAAEYGPIGPFESIDLAAWVRTINVNLIGTARVVRAALPALRRSDDPRILLFAGGGAFNPRPRYSAYATSKAGVVSLVETLAEELAPDIGVNGVSPGFVPTAIHRATLAAGPDLASGNEYAQALLAATYTPTAMERAVACVRHLLSPATKGLTGKTISAEHDCWQAVTAADVESLNDSPLWTRTRLGKKTATTLERI